MIRFGLPVLITLMLSGAAGAVSFSEVSPDEARDWIRHTVPLPKDISITSKVRVTSNKVTICSLSKPDMMLTQAVKELKESVPVDGRMTVGLPGGIPSNVFTIKLRIGGPEAEPLRKLKNSDQAYRILPGDNNKGLFLVALTTRGLYYAAKTLQQLINARATKDTVEMPIVHVTDWPDMEDRGLWGSDSFLHLRWLADRKMNIVEQISYIGVDDEGRAFARLKDGNEPMIEEGPLYGVKPVPVILHLEQVGGKGVFKAYPNLKGRSPHEGAICYSQPEFVDILADWIAALGSLPHVESVDVWMTENLAQQSGCACPECRSCDPYGKTDRSVLEARTILKAWEKAKEKVGSVGLRILTSEETENSNQLVFEELPPDVKVWYYHSLLTYTNREAPMLRKYLADFVRKGRWLGVCPNLDATVHWTSPFTGAHFIHYRMNEFVDKGLSGLLGYVTPRVHFFGFNVEAAAEWSWNAKGRSPHEFALSWAVRQGIKDPQKFAEWADVIGQVEWDVYGSHWPSGEQRNVPGPAAKRLRKGTLPELGYVLWDAYAHPFGDIKSVEQLDGDVSAAERAVELAREMGIPEFIHESLIAQGYINSLKALWELRGLVKPSGIADENREAAGRYFEMYVDGLRQVADELPKWEACVAREADPGPFTAKPVGVINGMIEQMKEVAAGLGFRMNDSL